LIFNHLS